MKGLEYFIDAAALIAGSRPDARFVIVGSAHQAQHEYLRRLQDRARLRGLAERLQFVGGRPDVESVYPAFDVMMITSLPRSEGTTTTAMEAMACGVPVVATRVGAVHEVVEHGVTGFLVEPCRADLLAERSLETLEASVGKTFGERGRAEVQERFDVRLCAERYRQAFAAAREHRARRGEAY
jgi:mannosyltransferase